MAETSLAYDRDVKVPLYARAGVPEAWVVDLAAGAVEVYASPEAHSDAQEAPPGGRYTDGRAFGREEELSSFTVADLRFAVRDAVGPGRARG